MNGLSTLEARIATDFEYLNFPPNNWVSQREDTSGRPMLDVLIVGGGMCGLAANLALRRVGIRNLRTIDASPIGQEGPWLTYARMETLRSPKHLTGPALGLPNLTFRAWYEAQFGQSGWDELGRIPRTQWAEYLEWYRRVTDVRIENGKTLIGLSPSENSIQAEIADTKTGTSEMISVRRVVLATGRDALATPRIPDQFANYIGKQAFHTSDAPTPEQFEGKRVIVIGLAASAFDYAAEALEAGAEQVTLLGRATKIPRINKAKQIVYPGFSQGFSALPDKQRFEIFRYISSHGVPPPRDTVLRVSRHDNFKLALGAEVQEIDDDGDGIELNTTAGLFRADTIVLGTGFKIDMSKAPFLDRIVANVATWHDTLTAEGRAQELLNFPYLGKGFEFQARDTEAQKALAIEHIHCFNHAAMLSLGNLANDIPAVSEGAERLSVSVASSLFAEEADAHYADLQVHVDPELLGNEIPQLEEW